MDPPRSARRLQDPLLRPSTPHCLFREQQRLSSRLRQGSSTQSGDPTTLGKRGYRGGPSIPGILQPHVRGSEGHGRVQTHSRSFDPKQICLHHQVQDGNCSDGDVRHTSRGLDGDIGFTRRLFSGTGPSRQPKIPTLCVARTATAISSALLRPLNSSSGFHSFDGPSLSGDAQTRISSSTLPRRLASSRFHRKGSKTGLVTPPIPMLGAGHSHQSGKVSLDAGAGEDLFGDSDLFDSFEGFPDPEENSQPTGVNLLLSQHYVPSSSTLAQTTGSHVFPHPSCPGIEEKNAVAADSVESAMGQAIVARGSPGQLGSRLQTGPGMVEAGQELESGAIPSGCHTRHASLHGRFHIRMGRIPSPGFSEWTLGQSRESTSHQCPRAKSDTLRPPSLCRGSDGIGGSHTFRQHHGSCVPVQGRRYPLDTSQSRGKTITRLGRGPLGDDHDPVCQRLSQCGRRLSEQASSNRVYGVDITCGGLQATVEGMGLPDSRPLRHASQLSTPKFCIPFSGSHSNSHGCFSLQLGQSGLVCLSPHSSHQEGPQQVTGVQQHTSHSHSPILATEGMVSRSVGSVGGTTPTASTSQRPPDAATRSQVSPRSPRAAADRMETVQRFLRHGGFDASVASFLAHDKRHSTSVHYQHKWKVYRRWCKERGHTVSKPTVQKIAQFLVHLRRECNLSTSTIKGYKAMLNGVFAYRGLDLNRELVLSRIVRACSLQPRRMARDLRPPWNLDVVLRHLSGAPFEPLRLASSRDLTRKTVFLLALATAQRVGEIQALSSRVSWQGPDLMVCYLPEFIAKTDTGVYSTPREFRIKSLSSVVNPEDEEHLLCPVRALSHYLQRTKSETRPRNLLLSVRRASLPMSKAAISFFLRDIIKEAHATIPDVICPEIKVKAHDIRGMAASMLLWKNCSIPSILKAARWRTHSVFANHYLKDISRKEGDVFSLGPFVSAGHVVG